MQNWFFRLVTPFHVNPGREWNHVWSRVVPDLALTNKNLMYGLLSISATHLLGEHPDDAALFAARQNYLIMAMREQRKMVAEISVEKADAVCLTSLMILVNAFAMLQERSLEPYAPPMDWVNMGRGAGTLIWESIHVVVKAGYPSNSSLKVIAESYPHFGEDTSYWEPSLRKAFDRLLIPALDAQEEWGAETQDAYEKTLSYIGSIQKSIDAGEPVYVVCRRVQVFSFVLPDKFVQMLSEQRHRALVVLAYFFATVAQIKGVWWLGEHRHAAKLTARREIEAIKNVLPPRWYGYMVWPLDMLGSNPS
jgi:hypothetical protein